MPPRPSSRSFLSLPAIGAALFALVCFGPGPGPPEATAAEPEPVRTWTQLSGAKVRARLTNVLGGNVILESYPARTRYAIPLDKLSGADHDYIRARTSQSSGSGFTASAAPTRSGSSGSRLFSKAPAPDRITATPDFLQTTPSARLPYSGRQHCGPAAACNALVYLSGVGYPKLILDGATADERQAAIARALGSAAFMKTADNGTNPWRLVSGLDTYIRFRGYEISKLEWQGWQPVPLKYSSRHKQPNLASAKRALARDNSGVLLNLGFYTRKEMHFTRQDGHWVTLVGFKDDHTLLAYDPSPRAGAGKRLHEIRLETFYRGSLGLSSSKTPIPAYGYHRISSAYPAPSKTHTGIIDGIVILELKKP